MTIEELQQKNIELMDQLKVKETELTTITNVKTTLEQEKANLEKTNNDLKEVNMKLYLRVSQDDNSNQNTNIIKSNPKKSNINPTSWDNFFDKYKK